MKSWDENGLALLVKLPQNHFTISQN